VGSLQAVPEKAQATQPVDTKSAATAPKAGAATPVVKQRVALDDGSEQDSYEFHQMSADVQEKFTSMQILKNKKCKTQIARFEGGAAGGGKKLEDCYSACMQEERCTHFAHWDIERNIHDTAKDDCRLYTGDCDPTENVLYDFRNTVYKVDRSDTDTKDPWYNDDASSSSDEVSKEPVPEASSDVMHEDEFLNVRQRPGSNFHHARTTAKKNRNAVKSGNDDTVLRKRRWQRRLERRWQQHAGLDQSEQTPGQREMLPEAMWDELESDIATKLSKRKSASVSRRAAGAKHVSAPRFNSGISQILEPFWVKPLREARGH
jgi:hypothetical protein